MAFLASSNTNNLNENQLELRDGIWCFWLSKFLYRLTSYEDIFSYSKIFSFIILVSVYCINAQIDLIFKLIWMGYDFADCIDRCFLLLIILAKIKSSIFPTYCRMKKKSCQNPQQNIAMQTTNPFHYNLAIIYFGKKIDPRMIFKNLFFNVDNSNIYEYV